MRLSIAVLTGALILCWTAPAQAQKKAPPSPAELLPANTIAYAEVQKPGLLARNIRELFKGTVLYNAPDSLTRLEDQRSYFQTLPFRVMGLMLAPEVGNELSKVQGAAAAFLGMKLERGDPQPEFVFLIQPGSGNAPRFLARMLLTLAPMKVSETVDGVKIYRAYYPAFNPAQRAAVISEHDPSVAMMKDYIFIGSQRAVKDCILRARGKLEGESLARDADFQAAQQKVGGEPGLFAFVKVSAAMELLPQITRGNREPEQIVERFVKALNPKALRAGAASLSLQKGTLHYHDVLLLDPREKSPLLELLPSRAANTDVLRFAPRDAMLAVAVSNDDGARRWKTLVKMLDEMLPAQALGGGNLRELIKGLEQQLNVKIGPDILGKVTNIGFAVGNPLTARSVVTRTESPGYTSMASETQVPMVLILETADEKAAGALGEVVSKLGGLAAHKKLEPETAKIHGQSISILKISNHYSVNYGVAGNTVVVGPYADGVARALADGAANKGIASDAKVLAQIKEFQDPIAAAVVRPGLLVASAFFGSHYTTARSATVDSPRGKDGQPERPSEPKTTVTIQQDSPEQAKMKKKLMDVMSTEPDLVIGVMRGADFITREGRSPGWDRFVPRIVNLATEMFLEESRRAGKAFETRREPAKATPVPGR